MAKTWLRETGDCERTSRLHAQTGSAIESWASGFIPTYLTWSIRRLIKLR